MITWYIFLWFWIGPFVAVSIGAVLAGPYIIYKALEERHVFD